MATITPIAPVNNTTAQPWQKTLTSDITSAKSDGLIPTAPATPPASSVQTTPSGGTITTINGGKVYSNPADNPNYNPPATLSNGVAQTVNSVSGNPPVIPATTVGGTTPVTVPETAPATSTAGPTGDLVGTNGPTAPTTDSNGNPITYDANGNPVVNQSNANDLLSEYMGESADEGKVAEGLDESMGYDQANENVASAQAAYNAAYTAYQSAQNQSNQQIENMQENNPEGESGGANNADIQRIQRENNANLANLAIVANVAQNNLTGDQASLSAISNIIQNKLNNQFAPINAQIGYLQTYIQNNKDNLSTSQQDELEATLQDATGDYAAMRTAATNAYATLQQYGALTLPNIQAIDAATTPAELEAALGAAINPSATPVANGTTAGSGTSPVSNYNLSKWSTDPTYTQQVTTASSTIGDVSLPSTASSVIQQYAPDSPINGTMLVATATAAGVDPNVLAAQLKVESNFGTDGAAVKNNNPLNLKFAGQPGATQGAAAPDGGYWAKFDNVQDGLTAGANQLALQKNQQTNPNPSASSNPSNTSGNSLAQYNALKQSAPSFIGSGLGYVAQTGDMYLPAPASSDPNAVAITNWAKQNNVTILPQGVQPSDVAALATAMTSISQIADAWQGVAPTSTASKVAQNFTTGLSTTFGTDTGNKIKNYGALSTQAYNAIGTVLGSSSLKPFLGTISQNALPTLTGEGEGWNPLRRAFGGDTLQDGNNKLNNLITTLNSSWKSIFPNSTGLPTISSGSSQSAQPYITTAPDGTQVQITG